MPTFVSWNTQSARSSGAGLDRLLAALDRFTDVHVLCLQEVAGGFRAQDEAPAVGCFAALAARLPGWQLAAFAPLDRRSREYARLLAPFEDGTPALCDAWRLAQPGRRHAPTVGLHDDAPGAGLPFTFDYAFVTAGLGNRIRQLRVDGAETGSDHQPLVLELDEGPADAG